MKLIINEKQLKLILSKEIELGEQDAETVSSEPTAGTSSTQSGGQGYPSVGKWESGVTRGAGNQIGITKWSDVVGSTIKRGKANPLKEGNEFADMMRGADLKKVEKDNQSFKDMMNSHDFLQVAAFVSDFIPYVGPLISLGLLSRDAQLYWEENQHGEAAASVVWAAIPGLQIVKKLGLLKWLPVNKFKELGIKILRGSKNFNEAEVKVLNQLSKYKKLIQDELTKNLDITINQAKRKVKKDIVKKNIAKTGANVVGTNVAASYANKTFGNTKK